MRDEGTEDERVLRRELAAAYQVFAMLGWTHLIHTHITVKVPGADHFLINPYGLLWEEITASSLVKVDVDGRVIEQGSTGYGINPAGFRIHSAIHTSERRARWVMHIHVPEVVAVASLSQGLIRGLSTYSMDLGPIAYHEYEHATNDETDVCERLVRDLGSKSKVLLLRNHGSITIGDTVAEAFFLTYQLVEACRVQIMTLSASAGGAGHTVVPASVLERTYSIVQNRYTGLGFGELEWRAACRQMEAARGLQHRD